MKSLLKKISAKLNANEGKPSKTMKTRLKNQYHEILLLAHKESPPLKKEGKKPGRTKQTTERNLLNRLELHQDAVLSSLENPEVPFTNNKAENDIRMTKVQQKISGCFRTFHGAQIFCRVRSYLLACQLNNIAPSEALNALFSGDLPKFLRKLDSNT